MPLLPQTVATATAGRSLSYFISGGAIKKAYVTSTNYTALQKTSEKSLVCQVLKKKRKYSITRKSPVFRFLYKTIEALAVKCTQIFSNSIMKYRVYFGCTFWECPSFSFSKARK